MELGTGANDRVEQTTVTPAAGEIHGNAAESPGAALASTVLEAVKKCFTDAKLTLIEMSKADTSRSALSAWPGLDQPGAVGCYPSVNEEGDSPIVRIAMFASKKGPLFGSSAASAAVKLCEDSVVTALDKLGLSANFSHLQVDLGHLTKAKVEQLTLVVKR